MKLRAPTTFSKSFGRVFKYKAHQNLSHKQADEESDSEALAVDGLPSAGSNPHWGVVKLFVEPPKLFII